MHDPMIVAFELKVRNTWLVTIWHNDPYADGTENSCDWSNTRRRKGQDVTDTLTALNMLESILDNRPYYPDHPAHKRLQPLKKSVWNLTAKPHRPWWKHPRWHVHHWSIQIHPILHLKRWLFSRCAGCGGRFTYGYSPTSTQWDTCGPRWFRGERKVYHHECLPPAKTPAITNQKDG